MRLLCKILLTDQILKDCSWASESERKKIYTSLDTCRSETTLATQRVHTLPFIMWAENIDYFTIFKTSSVSVEVTVCKTFLYSKH